MKHGYIRMIQRQKSHRSGDTVAHLVQKSFEHRSQPPSYWHLFFWDKDGIQLIDYLRKAATVTVSYYTSLLDKVKQALVSKWRRKLSQGVLFLQENASSHTAAITQQLADLHSQMLKHPACSPGLAPSFYHLLPNLRKHQ
jgi:hypothetical protein